MADMDKIVKKWSTVAEDIEKARDKEFEGLPKIEAQSIHARCPKCGNTESDSLDARMRHETGENFFQGYEIRCLKCGESSLRSI
jgi:predicted nucleic-acid-binding Zn-ribbon protein